MQLTVQPNYHSKTVNYKKDKTNETKNYPLFYMSNKNLKKDTVSFKGGSPEKELIELLGLKDRAILALQDELKAKDETILCLQAVVETKDKLISKLQEHINFADKTIRSLKEDNDKLFKILLLNKKLDTSKDLLKDQFIRPARLEHHSKTISEKIEKSTIPDRIIITGTDKSCVNHLAQWTTEESELGYSHIDFAETDKKDALEMLDDFEKRRKNPRMSKQIFTVDPSGNAKAIPLARTILRISNFEKFTNPTKNNEVFIARLKKLFKSCSEDYRCTVIVDAENVKDISPELITDEQFPLRIDLND